MTRLSIFLLALAAAACGSNSTSPSTTTSTTTTPSTEFFETSISHGDTTFYSFTVNSAGTVSVTLASVTQQGHIEPLSIPLRIGLGTPAGEGCAVTDSVDTAPSLTAQLNVTMTVGIHCVSVADTGQVSSTVIAAMRFSHL